MHVELLRSSFERAVEREEHLTTRFYAVLFERYPAVRPLFGGNSSEKQREMLQRTLVAVLENLENAAWLDQALFALGAKHVAYGVTREMFDWVGDALLATLAEALDDGWNDDVAAAWQEAYAVLRDGMLLGMAQATAVPTPPSSAATTT